MFNGVSTILNAVEPETIKAVEVGVKSDVSRLLRINLSAFHYNYDNLRVTAYSPTQAGVFLLQNAASSKIYGGELEVTAKLPEGFSLEGNVAYLHARYSSFPGAQAFLPLPSGGNAPAAIDASGNAMVRAPDWTFNVAPHCTHDLGPAKLDINASVFHSSRVYWDFANTVLQKPFTLVGAGIGLESGRWRFDLATTNLFDQAVFGQVRQSANTTDTFFLRPRGVTLGVSYTL